MRFSAQLNAPAFVVPPNHATRSTTSLLTSGLAATLQYPGMPSYSPIGFAVLDAIERRIASEGERLGFMPWLLPSVMSHADLEGGEPIGEQFGAKIMSLAGEDLHLLTSPEMLFVRAIDRGAVSYRALPLRHSYLTTIHRRRPKLRNLIQARAFRIYGAISFEPDERAVARALDALLELTVATLEWLGAPSTVERSDDSFEVVTPFEQGDMRLGDGRGLSIARGFPYRPEKPLPAYRARENADRPLHAATFATCTSRMLLCAFDRARDEAGFALPAALRPFDVVVSPKAWRAVDEAAALVADLERRGVRVGFDDRCNMTTAQRVAFSDFIGAAGTVLIDDGDATLILRRSGVATAVPMQATAILQLLGT